MRARVVFAHPVGSSYNAALHQAVVRGLTRAGHTVDDLDPLWRAARPVLTRDVPTQMTRAVRWYLHPSARCRYLALYDMNSATEAKRKAFLGACGARNGGVLSRHAAGVCERGSGR